MVEIMRGCPLRSCFEASADDYERRMTYAGRVGTAFHRTLEWLIRTPVVGSPQVVAEEARTRFLRELRQQEADMAVRPREQSLPRSDNRVHRAVEAVVAEAHHISNRVIASELDHSVRPNEERNDVSYRTARLNKLNFQEPQSVRRTSATANVEVEVEVGTRDGYLRGRVDRAEYTPDGIHLYDYKSALRDDLPERYAHQIQLYALMWQQTRGEWPIHAEVIYPLTGSAFNVAIEPSQCEQAGREAVEIIRKFTSETRTDLLATPGDSCKVCEFRPWCEPFWHWQNEEPNDSIALTRSSLGFEGEVISMQINDGYWRISLKWRERVVTIVCPAERLPHLRKASVGTQLRVLDADVAGLRHKPRASITALSEIFIVVV